MGNVIYEGYEGFNDPEIDTSALKDGRGQQRTESLFHEVIQPSSRLKYEPLYSLRDYEHKGYPSAYLIYMNSIDERDAALKLVGSMSHWRKLCACEWFLEGRIEVQFEGLEQWREDMIARDATLAKEVLMKNTSQGNVTAAKALHQTSKDEANNVASPRKKPKRKPSKTKEESIVESLVDELESKRK